MKKRLFHLLFVSMLSVSVFVFIASVIVSPTRGVPGTGTSITVKNLAEGTIPSSDWSYKIIELSPPTKSKPYTASFQLPAAGGGTYAFGGLRSGSYKVTETSKFGYSSAYTVTSNKNSPGPDGTGFEVVINLASSEGKTVTFTNTGAPAFAMTGLIVPPPSDLGYSIPPLKPIPVQASWDVDINNDGRLDLVLGKPTVILVNLVGPSFPEGSSITVSVMYEGKVYTRVVTASDLSSNTVVSFYSADIPIVPSSAGDKQITGVYQVNGGAPVALYTTDVTVKDTISLSLYYAALTKSDYGSPATFSEMMQESRDFIDATYPVKSVTATVASQSTTGSKPGSRRDPYAGMLKDAQAVAQQAQLYMGGSAVGVAIAPISATTDYFAYHGFPGAAGVSFGPAVKGVIALDGYWTVPAHEVAHTFGLYYGVPEEYVLPGNPFRASGVCYSTGEWRAGYNFMSVAEYKKTDLTWVNTTSTFDYLFRKTRVIPNDPSILLVNGIVYKNPDGSIGGVEFPLDWVRVEDGTPDTLIPGDYLLKFVKADGTTSYQISFGVSFEWQIDYPGDPMGGEKVAVNEAGFSFAISYPPPEIVKIEVVKSTAPDSILATYYMTDVKSFGCSASLVGTEGLNDWYVSPVTVTITGIADPTATQPYYVSEIHYILDGGEDTQVSGNTATFPILTDGTHSLEYWGVDNLRSPSVHHTLTVKIDTAVPSVAVTSPADNAYVNTATVAVIGTSSDSTSGVDKVQVGVDGSAYADATPKAEEDWSTWSFTTASLSDGSHYITAKAIDKAGKTAETSVTITVDTAKPVTTRILTGTEGLNGWYVSSVGVALSATDNGGSGVKEVHYKLDGVETTVSGSTASFTISTDGTHTLEHWAVDNAGNVEAHVTQTIKIDKTPPVVIITSPADGSTYMLNQAVLASWTATDATSGIASATGTVPSGSLIDTSAVGAKTFTVTAFDNAGNKAEMTVTYNVGYVFCGFLSPIPNSKYNLGRTVPVKFQLKDSQGNFVTTAVARIYVAQKEGGIWKDVPGYGNLFEYNSATNTYQFNLDTTGLHVGDLQIRVELDYDTSHTVPIILK